MMRVAIANQKGRSGKDHHRYQHRHRILPATGWRTLLIDLDPQGNASTGVGIPAATRDRSSYDVLIDQAPLAKCVMPTAVPGLDILPATVDLSGAEVELVNVEHRTDRLRTSIADDTAYDIAFIDCPPSLGMLTLNALSAADTLLVPLQCEFFALEGLSQLLQTVESVRQRFNADLGIIGVVLTMFDRRNRLSDLVADDVRECLGQLVFDVTIPRKRPACPKRRAMGCRRSSTIKAALAARAYMALAQEMIGRLPERRKAA